MNKTVKKTGKITVKKTVKKTEKSWWRRREIRPYTRDESLMISNRPKSQLRMNQRAELAAYNVASSLAVNYGVIRDEREDERCACESACENSASLSFYGVELPYQERPRRIAGKLIAARFRNWMSFN